MKHARIRHQDRILAVSADYDSVPGPEGAPPTPSNIVPLPDGSRPAEDALVWLPPIEFGTIFALGLNYADHVKELAFAKAPEEPLVFLKGPDSLTGHRGRSPRPAGVDFMHYECELAVVIGSPCRDVDPSRATEVIAGYTVANDYAIRDYLENYYRPNLRVQNRDRCTPIGPWLVDATDVGDPMDLRLETRVNGRVTQRGSTRDMILDVARLIAHLSGFMTLNPGEEILTGTPEGVVDTRIGDVVETRIEHVGTLTNTLCAEAGEGPAL